MSPLSGNAVPSTARPSHHRWCRRLAGLAGLAVTLALGACHSPILRPDPGGAADTQTGPIRSPDEWNQRYTAFLQRHADAEGYVDYAAIRRDPTGLNRLYAWIAQHSPDSHPGLFPEKADRFAYWLNSYNLAVIVGVTRHYPIDSVRDIRPLHPVSLKSGGGFFVALRFVFGGETKRLYFLENNLIRERFEDPRLHFALNCASLGCPELPREAFAGERLEAQLARETRAFLRSPENFRIDHETETIRMSALFDWFRKDFLRALRRRGVEDPSLPDYVLPYLGEARRQTLMEVRDQYTVAFLPYDWSLNDRN